MKLLNEKVRLIQIMIIANTQRDKTGLLQSIEEALTIEDEKMMTTITNSVERVIACQRIREARLKGVENETEQ